MDFSGGIQSSRRIPFRSELIYHGQEAFHFPRLVVELAVYLREPDEAVIPKRLQCPLADMQQAAHVLPVQPVTHFLVTAPAVQHVHFLRECAHPGKQGFKSRLFDNYYFHI